MRRTEMRGQQQMTVRRAFAQQPPARCPSGCRVLAEAAVDVGIAALDRIVHRIADEQPGGAAAARPDHRVAGGMAVRRLDGQAVIEAVAIVHQMHQSGLDHRQHAVLDHGAAHLGRGGAGPVLIFAPPKQIPGARESRHPASVLQTRVPPDMVHVQMRAHDEIDLLRRDAGRRQPLQPRHVQLIEAGKLRPVLVVADACVDQHDVVRGTDQPGMDAGDEGVQRRVVVARHHPVAMPLQRLRRQVRQQHLRRKSRAVAFLDALHLQAADRDPNRVHCRVPLACDAPGKHAAVPRSRRRDG